MFFGTLHVTGYFCLFIAVAMVIPMAVDIAAGDPNWLSFLTAGLLTGVVAGLMILSTQGRMPPFSLRFGFLLVNALWCATSVTAGLPLFLSEEGISFTDAVFEAVSGITTTGSTVLIGLETMPPGLLLWRSLTQWIGGLGIIAMSLLLLPFLQVGGMQIFRMESSTRTDNPFARFVAFSWGLLGLYLSISAVGVFAFMLSGMSIFDAVNHAMAAVSTGGFGTRDTSMIEFGNAPKIVAIVIMLAGAMPFIAILRAAVTRELRSAYDPQIPVLLMTVAIFSFAVALSSFALVDTSAFDHLVNAAFNITSVITTTGFASSDYTQWGSFAVAVFFVATFLGGASGSTSGGFKTYRLIILGKAIARSLRELIYPNGVFIVRYDHGEVSSDALRQVATFFAAFMAVWLFGTLAIALTGLDLVTSLTGMLTALTNTGPGLGPIIGPVGNFAPLPDTAKWILILGMLLGRLEIMTMLVLLSPAFWRH